MEIHGIQIRELVEGYIEKFKILEVFPIQTQNGVLSEIKEYQKSK